MLNQVPVKERRFLNWHLLSQVDAGDEQLYDHYGYLFNHLHFNEKLMQTNQNLPQK